MDKGGTDRIREALADLCEPLHDTFARAGAATSTSVKGSKKRKRSIPDLSGPEYGWHRTHTIRAYAHYYLKQRDLGAWGLSGNHRRNGELWLSDGSYRARLLHGPSKTDVPPPGPNLSRRAYYRNPRLPLPDPLFGPADDRLLVLWRLDAQTGAPAFRVVRPIGNWKYGRKAQVDIDFPLPQSADELADIYFEPSDDEIHLNIPNEESNDDFRAGGISG
ncbi:hypothetical protein [Streptomyces microflavus]|uniref:hypothetical protein n=1 Tax=Streptomyces microflavus TaxID=1919 RepID=UPI0033EEFBC4